MSGDICGCEKCGESIYTHCDCGLPSDLSEELENLRAQNEKLKKALEAISKNTCCEPCQEAKKVAQVTLAELDKNRSAML